MQVVIISTTWFRYKGIKKYEKSSWNWIVQIRRIRVTCFTTRVVWYPVVFTAPCTLAVITPGKHFTNALHVHVIFLTHVTATIFTGDHFNLPVYSAIITAVGNNMFPFMPCVVKNTYKDQTTVDKIRKIIEDRDNHDTLCSIRIQHRILLLWFF